MINYLILRSPALVKRDLWKPAHVFLFPLFSGSSFSGDRQTTFSIFFTWRGCNPIQMLQQISLKCSLKQMRSKNSNFTTFRAEPQHKRSVNCIDFSKVFFDGIFHSPFWVMWFYYRAMHYSLELECGPMPNPMVALPNTGGALCSTPQFGWRPLLDAVQ